MDKVGGDLPHPYTSGPSGTNIIHRICASESWFCPFMVEGAKINVRLCRCGSVANKSLFLPPYHTLKAEINVFGSIKNLFIK
jgi:hypothetical protein